jgi:hypothetical protein
MDIERLSRFGGAVRDRAAAIWAATAFMVVRLMVGTLALPTRRIAETRHVR